MRKLILSLSISLSLMLCSAATAVAQNAVYVFPPTPRTPTGGVQSLTAVVNNNTNKAVTWSKSGAACTGFVGSGNTIGVTTSGTGTCTITATMVADGTTTASSTVTVEALRTDLQASSIHPRLALTAADVTDLQTKITNAGNKAYTVGLQGYFASTQTYYNSVFCWTGGGCGTVGPIGTLNSCGWVDANDCFTANQGGTFEQSTALYALMALIDPVTGNRATWAAHAHDMAMWEMNEICYDAYSGTGACVARNGTPTYPFIGTQFAMNNRSQTAIPYQLEAIDWNYSSFSSGDKAIIVQVGHIWGQEASYGDQVANGNEYVTPTGSYNTSAIISGNIGQGNWGANNFSLGHFQLLAFYGTLLDPADDPTVSSTCSSGTTTVCSDGTTEKVSAYGIYAVKGWLYRINAIFEDQHIVNSEYGLSDPYICPDVQIGTTTCTGELAGGQSNEGTGYPQISMTEMFTGLYALYTSGKLNPSTDPQAAFISSSFWDKNVLSWLDQFYNVYESNYSPGSYYIPFGSDSQTNGNIVEMPFFNILEIYDAKYGSTWRKNIDKFYTYNAQYGSYASYGYRFLQGVYGGAFWAPNVMQATSGTNDGDFDSSGNPTAGAYDPRNTSTLPLDFENLAPSNGFYRYYGRSSWANATTQFQFGCSSGTIDHAMPSCGRIDYVRNGEALAIGLNGTENDDQYAQAPIKQNMTGYQYNPSFDCTLDGGIILGICSGGGIMDNSWMPSSSTLTATSSNGTYYYAAVDSSNGYSVYIDSGTYAGSQNVTLGQREVLWLKPDQIWVYDRTAQTLGTGFQVWNLDLETNPSITANKATMTATSGQLLYINSLLPGTSALTASALSKSGNESGSPMNYLLVDTATPAATNRMLHTIEGKTSGGASSSTHVASSAGNPFDCGTVGTTIACFIKTRGSFTGTTYAASGATTQYVAGLAANTSYPISGAGAPTSAVSDTAGVLTFAATGTGNITVGAGTSPANAPTFAPVAGTYSGTQNVVISSTSSGALICYNTTGSSIVISGSSTCPGGSTQYTTAISVASSETLYAVAGGTGYADSTLSSAAYIITAPAPSNSYGTGLYMNGSGLH